jgi:predicted DNA-binding protein (MmcQ/YjbR family)
MNRIVTETIRNYCLAKSFVTESFPFDDTTLVLKVKDKIFLLLNLDPPFSMNVKCDPERAIELREQYDFVEPGYHMNKKHWNTIRLDQPVPINKLFLWIDHSYDLVLSGLPKKKQMKKPQINKRKCNT